MSAYCEAKVQSSIAGKAIETIKLNYTSFFYDLCCKLLVYSVISNKVQTVSKGKGMEWNERVNKIEKWRKGKHSKWKDRKVKEIKRELKAWKRKDLKRKQVRQVLPNTMQVAEVYPLPEAAAKTVTKPTGNGKHPQSHWQLGQSQNLRVSAAEKETTCYHNNPNRIKTVTDAWKHPSSPTFSSQYPECKANGGRSSSERRHWL